ncbi:hypothetical protein SLEP1_g57701 [Rubroshorea leprosula]|uniref:Uncharacterized protein n=1 Tax=Rubroshorea leprosula TaxID=152421 RepID=A0AAV5MPW3_9ROSI|nr:hypothetical protein SLEP1_g57701 [Rubroshorea leprosula]
MSWKTALISTSLPTVNNNLFFQPYSFAHTLSLIVLNVCSLSNVLLQMLLMNSRGSVFWKQSYSDCMLRCRD